MQRKRLIIFSVIFVLLVMLALWKQGVWQENAQSSKYLFPQFKAEQALKIETKKADQGLSLVKEKGLWVVASQDNYPASQNFVDNLLTKVEVLNVDRVASQQQEKHSQFEVDKEKGLEVKIYAEKQKLLAHFYLGKQSPDYMSTYLRKEGQKEVLAIGGALSHIFSRPDWRERQVFTFKVEDVKKLTLSYPDKEIMLVQEPEEGWQLVLPEPGEARKEEVTKLFSTLLALRIVRFVEDGPPKPAETGLAEPSLKISCQLEDGRQVSLLLGKPKEALRYAKWGEGDFIYFLPENRLKPLWENKDLLKPKAEDLKQPAEKAEPEPEAKSESKPKTKNSQP